MNDDYIKNIEDLRQWATSRSFGEVAEIEIGWRCLMRMLPTFWLRAIRLKNLDIDYLCLSCVRLLFVNRPTPAISVAPGLWRPTVRIIDVDFGPLEGVCQDFSDAVNSYRNVLSAFARFHQALRRRQGWSEDDWKNGKAHDLEVLNADVDQSSDATGTHLATLIQYFAMAQDKPFADVEIGSLRFPQRHDRDVDKLWRLIAADVESVQDLATRPLWLGAGPEVNAQVWELVKQEWAAAEGIPTQFWQRWYQSVLDGRPMKPELLRNIADIPDVEWRKGAGHVAKLIDGIENAFKDDQPLPDSLIEAQNLPIASATQVAAIRVAMEHNRAALPPTFDAIEGLILLEIERLQGRNITDDLDQSETVRQIGIYLSLYDAIGLLRTQLPITGVVTEAHAEKSERLLRIYCKKFAELPLAKVHEVVEGFWNTGRGILQAGLIGSTTALAVSYGLPALAGLSIGAMIFAPKNATDLIRSAREALLGAR